MKKLNRQSGFGLLEVLLSIAIFIIIVGALVSLNRLALRNVALATHRAQAYNLAQDALETIQQMRDTAWIDGVDNSLPKDAVNDWLAFVHTCDSPGNSSSPDPSDYKPIEFKKNQVDASVNYTVCFDSRGGFNRFGLTEDNKKDTNGTAVSLPSSLPSPNPANIIKPDPGDPQNFMVKINFEPVPDSPVTESTPGSYTGLQLLNDDGNGNPTILGTSQAGTGAESIHFVKVRATVTWSDFNQSWSVDLTTLLSNWRQG